MTDKTELLPCPFCGSKKISELKYGIGASMALCCDSCGAEGPEKGTRSEAIKAWNARAPVAVKDNKGTHNKSRRIL